MTLSQHAGNVGSNAERKSHGARTAPKQIANACGIRIKSLTGILSASLPTRIQRWQLDCLQWHGHINQASLLMGSGHTRINVFWLRACHLILSRRASRIALPVPPSYSILIRRQQRAIRMSKLDRFISPKSMQVPSIHRGLSRVKTPPLAHWIHRMRAFHALTKYPVTH